MSQQAQTAEDTAPQENFFDENGNTVEASAPEGMPADPEDSGESAAPAAVPEGRPHKYRIGERTFATQDEALAYAQSLDAELQVADAYRQGMRDAISQPSGGENVTPQAPPAEEFNTEELYTDPNNFLKKFATKIKTETQAELDRKENMRTQSDQIWREFTDRHPALADFRSEVETFTSQNLEEVRALIAVKGRPAGYDYVATKLKSRFAAYANAVKPKRELPNTTMGAALTNRTHSVTPKEGEKKALSFSEQIRSIRKRRQ